jgi:hypothetical protein
MDVQDFIYWIGAVFVLVVANAFALPRMSVYIFNDAVNTAKKSDRHNASDYYVSAVWAASMIWGLIQTVAALFFVWFYQNVW